jgi:chromosomal replication initiator protein
MNAEQAWQATLGQLQMDMSKAAFDTWVKNSALIDYKDGSFTISVPNAYARDWLDTRLSATVSSILTGIMNQPEKVRFIVGQPEPAAIPEPAPVSVPVDVPLGENKPRTYVPNPTLHPKYTFENFVVGPSNRMAHAACQSVAENPARSYNPLFLYGGVGLGKTHLLHAIGNSCLQKGLEVLYISAEEFTNDLINAIREHDTQAFRDKYRTIDVLLVDDIQFIAGKEATQEEFFHTFNTLHGQDKQIVICSDRPPKALVTLEERLRSRFEWGLTVDLQPPDLETKMAILSYKVQKTGRKITSEQIESIARRVTSNIRELEGALNRVMAYADLCGCEINSQLINSALAEIFPQTGTASPEQVIKAVSDSYNIPIEKLSGRGRSKDVVLPRQVAMYLMRQDINASLPQIGAALGGRDHTTVMYACDKIADMMERDDHLRRQILQIRERVSNQRQYAY